MTRNKHVQSECMVRVYGESFVRVLSGVHDQSVIQPVVKESYMYKSEPRQAPLAIVTGVLTANQSKRVVLAELEWIQRSGYDGQSCMHVAIMGSREAVKMGSPAHVYACM